MVSHHVELLLPSADYFVRILDGRIDLQGTPDELRAAGELDGLVAIEEAEAAKTEPVTTQEDVEQEVAAVDGEPKKEKKKGPGKKLIQGMNHDRNLPLTSQTRNEQSATSNGRHTSCIFKPLHTSPGCLLSLFLVRQLGVNWRTLADSSY